MATSQRQSQFYRRVPAALAVALSLLTAPAVFADDASAPTVASAAAAASAPAEPPSLTSGYQRIEGAPFFLLADSGFTSDTIARVRVEGDPDTFDAYGGVDVVVYKVPAPLDFLKGQKDLHRIQVDGDYAGEGLANTLSFLWDKWFKKSRMVFQQIFSGDARQAVVAAAPTLKQAAPDSYSTTFHAAPQYRLLKQFSLVERFRYPVAAAAPIAPPAGTQLAGSSSNFIEPAPGNVYVPLGKLQPGLYFVEAYVGAHRATTLVFVANTVGVTKTAGKSMLVWSTDRRTGKPATDVDIVWSDGNGVLQSAHTDADGIAAFERAVPEKSYTLGQDKEGGVFVSENFYYDSEIYNSKLYVFTDRPLYKPGDRVRLKVFGREFTGARASQPIKPADVSLRLLDPSGQELLQRPLHVDAASGGDTELTLPANAFPGGYEVRFDYRDATYSAMFRVADYALPAFDVSIQFDRDDFHVGEPITGRVLLHYPNGTPLTDASVALDLKSQALSVTNGDPEFGARFPRKLAQTTLHVGADGSARFTLPAATVASRYLLQAVGSEHNIFPVSANRELILQPAPGQPAPAAPVTASASGPGVMSGAIAITLDKPRYQAGDVAHVTIRFPQPVGDALLTLERDQIEARALLSHPADWLHLTQLSSTSTSSAASTSASSAAAKPGATAATVWQADIPIKDDYGPNITFSVLYVSHGDFNFQNAGIQVTVPALDVAIHTDKSDYRPGDKVTVELDSSVAGKPVAAVLSAGVVDDMVYTLQPEVAPSIFDFFYHPRRDSVRTTASLDFYGYDLAWSPHGSSEAKFDYNQRALKVLTRPRRENIDTAAWQPTLKTDAHGHVSFSFTMPDSLSRWRITARGVTPDGVVGQRSASITSSKPVYLRWSGPTRFRQGDAPHIGLLVFNQQPQAVAATLKVDGVAGAVPARDLTLQPGQNFIDLSFNAQQDAQIDLLLSAAGHTLDHLQVPLRVDAAGWSAPHSRLLGAGDPLQLPPDARDVRLQAATGSQQAFGAIIDSLIDYPYGCVEQTASQMIPLTIALDGIPDDAADRALRSTLLQRLQTARMRLSTMAGPNADFAWWGDQSAGDPLLTSYAYYADWRATARLGITLAPEHWQHVFDTYQAGAARQPLLERALTLWLMQAMQLPVRTLVGGLQHDLSGMREPAPDGVPDADTSVILGWHGARVRWQMSLLLWRDLVRRAQLDVDPALAAKAAAAQTELEASNNPVLAALAYGLAGTPNAGAVAALAGRFNDDTPTMERALALIWLQAGVQRGAADVGTRSLRLDAHWRFVDSAGGGYWRYLAPPAALTAAAVTAASGASVTPPMPNAASGAAPTTATTATTVTTAPAAAAASAVTAATPPPATLQFSTPPGTSQRFRLSYQSAAPELATLPVTLTRHLYRLTPTKKPGVFQVAKAGAVLSANALYVDEIVLTPRDPSQVLRYGLVEVPVPAGTEVEAQRFGFEIDGLSPLVKPKAADSDAGTDASADSSADDSDSDTPEAEDGTPLLTSEGVLSADQMQQFAEHYAVPVATLHGTLTIRHLIRLGQAGQFGLPAARYYRMYQPSAKAFDAAGHTTWTVQ